MVDSITESDVHRVEANASEIDTDQFTYDELRQALTESGLSPSQASAFADEVRRNRPDPTTQARHAWELRDAGQVEVVGDPEQGPSRRVQVRDDSGRFRAGDLSELQVFEDRWGNLMAQPQGAPNSERFKIRSKEVRGDRL